MNGGGRRYIIAGGLIDGTGADVRRNVCLVVEDSIIAAIGPVSQISRKAGAAVDDFSHCTMLPALVDCSVYLSRSPSVDKRMQLSSEQAGLAAKMALIGRHIHYCHAHGVLGVADGGDGQNLVGRHRKGRPEWGEIDIRTSGRLCRGGEAGEACEDADGDFLKIAYSGGIADEEDACPRLDHADLCRFLQRRDGQMAVVVANGERQVAEAIEAGCDAIEQGYSMGEDNLRKMAEKNILWIPSVLQAKNALDGSGSGGEVCCRFSLRYVAPGRAVPGGEAFWKKVLADQLAQLRFARKTGVRTAVGTGAGSMGILHGESVAEEMKLFIKAGYSLGETFHCASENGARFFGMNNIGPLAVGNKATFLITRGTAQQLPRKLSYLEGIYVGGAPSATYRKNPA
ncbi:MAG: amidohydrolase [Desulfobacterales bacterium GWB2_56_26]|nr:MAG: amidohydrolase [Desulfobacterales bacterium GWB2_56_26]